MFFSLLLLTVFLADRTVDLLIATARLIAATRITVAMDLGLRNNICLYLCSAVFPLLLNIVAFLQLYDQRVDSKILMLKAIAVVVALVVDFAAQLRFGRAMEAIDHHIELESMMPLYVFLLFLCTCFAPTQHVKAFYKSPCERRSLCRVSFVLH